MLETAGPPVHYVDPEDIVAGTLRPCAGLSWCEWKGAASYFDLVAGGVSSPSAAWCYRNPPPAFHALAGWVAIYAGRVDRVELAGELVHPQPGDYYGGWITSRVTGPFKGDAGTTGW